ncbi:MAG: ATP-binding cassette, subfamily bacterial MsbA [Acidobacteriota bacterium]|nr:ATP-binding cassette, subfamily bacterial MsbA [Acidobacteriota bacterium]
MEVAVPSSFCYNPEEVAAETPTTMTASRESLTLSLSGTFRKLLPFLRPHRSKLIGAGSLLLVSLALELTAPLLLKQLIDTTLASRDLGRLNTLIGLFAGLYLLRFVMELGGGRLRNRFNEGLLFDLRQKLFAHVQTLSSPFFTQQRSGYLASRILNDASLLSHQLLAILLGALSSVLLLVGSVVIVFWLNWQLAVVLCLIGPLLVVLTQWFGGRVRNATEEMQEHGANLGASVQESVAGVSLIQSYSLEKFAQQRVGSEMAKLRSNGIHLADLALQHRNGILVMTSLAGLGVLWFGSRSVMGGALTLGDLMAFLAYAVNVYRPVQELTSLNLTVQSAKVAASRIFALLDTAPTICEAPGAVPLATPVRGHVRCSGLSFAYEKNDVLSDVSFEIQPGMKVALVGRSGAGKTTLLNHLPRFYDPRLGKIEIDGQDVRGVQLASLRAAIAVVAQETFLFSGSVRENLLCVRPSASEADLRKALEGANLLEWADALPQGMDTQVGERGVRLSGGERQRLSIARALLKDAPVLILDEATSSLDSVTEKQIRSALGRLLESGKTCFVIAHRLTTIRDADWILVLDKGRLVGQGTHAELYASNTVYARLFDEQFAGAPSPVPTHVMLNNAEEFFLREGNRQSRVVVQTDDSGQKRVVISSM